MDIIHVTEARRFSRDRANRFGLLDRPRLVCDLVCLEPGQRENRREYETSDELYYIIEGNAKVRMGSHEYDLGVEQALLVPPRIQHYISNPGPGRLTALAVVAPKPGREAEVRPRLREERPERRRPRGPEEPERRPGGPTGREAGRPAGAARGPRGTGEARRPPGGPAGPRRGRAGPGRGRPGGGGAAGRRAPGGPRRPGPRPPGGGPSRGPRRPSA